MVRGTDRTYGRRHNLRNRGSDGGEGESGELAGELHGGCGIWVVVLGEELTSLLELVCLLSSTVVRVLLMYS